MPEVRYHLTEPDLRRIADGIRLRPASPPGVLASIVAAVTRHEDLEAYAGLLLKVILASDPYGLDTSIFALQASRVALVANGHQWGKVDVIRAEALLAAVTSGQLEDAAEIGKRLAALDR